MPNGSKHVTAPHIPQSYMETPPAIFTAAGISFQTVPFRASPLVGLGMTALQEWALERKVLMVLAAPLHTHI